MFDIDDALRHLIVNEGSDLHLKVPAPPIVRVHGRMTPIEGEERLKPEDTERVLREILNDPAKLEEFESENEVDFSYQLEGLARFRVNAFRQRGSISLVMRAIPFEIKSADDLGQAELVDGLDDHRDGAHDDRDRAALQEGVDAEAAQALDGVGEVDLVLGLELRDLVRVVEHLLQRVARVLGEQALGTGDRLQVPVQADQRIGRHLQVQVGALSRDEIAQGVIEIESHVPPSSALVAKVLSAA